VFTIGPDTQSGTWSFSTQSSGTGGTLSFSASQALIAGQVPAPTAVWLMGTGLLGIISMAPLKKAA